MIRVSVLERIGGGVLSPWSCPRLGQRSLPMARMTYCKESANVPEMARTNRRYTIAIHCLKMVYVFLKFLDSTADAGLHRPPLRLKMRFPSHFGTLPRGARRRFLDRGRLTTGRTSLRVNRTDVNGGPFPDVTRSTKESIRVATFAEPSSAIGRLTVLGFRKSRAQRTYEAIRTPGPNGRRGFLLPKSDRTSMTHRTVIHWLFSSRATLVLPKPTKGRHSARGGNGLPCLGGPRAYR
jgi:hypothetical protein